VRDGERRQRQLLDAVGERQQPRGERRGLLGVEAGEDVDVAVALESDRWRRATS
jgi:hypothetical protein